LKTGEDGAQLVFFKDEKYPPAMILKKDGATLYATRDLATDKYRKEKYNPDLVINEVGQEQELYFKQLFEIETRLGWYKKEQRIHVAHGMYRFKEGKMSTRKGNVIWLEEVLDEAEKKATAKEIAIGALKWNDLKGSAKRDIVFDWDEILNMEGNSGPYLQYTYARCRSVIAKSNSQIDPERSRKTTDLTNPDGLVLRTLYRFDEVVTQAAEELSPSLVANFLYDLAQRYNNFYNVETILKAPVGKKEFRLWLTHATAEILKKGLYLLGIEVPSRM
ncbi:MAG TPA: arginine--tRNA ligase, partial [Patescibacteria group bacterium]|nr:arginine--tRNA ligase [Patescibacteria group bacterium]